MRFRALIQTRSASIGETIARPSSVATAALLFRLVAGSSRFIPRA